MLWSFVLPFKLTVGLLLAIIVAITVVGSTRGWKLLKTLLLSSLVAIVAFIPSCVGVMVVVDSFRFGNFNYASYDDVSDFRSQRYLPKSAANIAMQKHSNGYRARYDISSSDFHTYLDDLWERDSQCSAVRRGSISGEGTIVTPTALDSEFAGLRWSCPTNAVIYYSPREADGGGATYYFDAEAGVALQRTGFW